MKKNSYKDINVSKKIRKGIFGVGKLAANITSEIADFIVGDYENDADQERPENLNQEDNSYYSNLEVRFSDKILEEFRNTVGKYPAETGGMLACSEDDSLIDEWYFDKTSVNTAVSYSYDADVMTGVHRNWKEQGKKSVGFIHSHPRNYPKPSYDDVATAYALMKYFKNNFFYLPIVMSDRKGMYTIHMFVIRKDGDKIIVNRSYTLKAVSDGYELVESRKWEKQFSTKELEAYYAEANGLTTDVNRANEGERIMKEELNNNEMTTVTNEECFQRIAGEYPEHVLDKVNVIIGNGGARPIPETFARHGFRNFVLIDGDKVAPSNIATQGVFRSEIGMYKPEAIKKRILDINPDARVICVNRFLDDSFSDEKFEDILKEFPNKIPTDFLIYGCTDSHRANHRSSLLALKYGIPYIGAAMYKKGYAAEIIFVYPGVTPSCPRCLLRPRYEAYEQGYINDVTSSGCSPFDTERLNTTIGKIALMMLMYNEDSSDPRCAWLDRVKDRNFVWIRMNPDLGSSDLGIRLFDRTFASSDVSKYVFMDESLWVPQHPDSPENGEEACNLCGGVGDLRLLKNAWTDTRTV